MPAVTTELFADTMARTGQWIDRLMEYAAISDPRQAYSILRAVLHVLRDRLTTSEAVDLGAQLPMLVRGIYYDGWNPAARPAKYRHKAEFLQGVAAAYPGLPQSRLEPAVRAVFRVLSGQVTGGEIRQVRNQLPEEVRDLWEQQS
jgi:uncharacterized protein (DUF2267 family)